jgi:hypothetical protein
LEEACLSLETCGFCSKLARQHKFELHCSYFQMRTDVTFKSGLHHAKYRVHCWKLVAVKLPRLASTNHNSLPATPNLTQDGEVLTDINVFPLTSNCLIQYRLWCQFPFLHPSRNFQKKSRSAPPSTVFGPRKLLEWTKN